MEGTQRPTKIASVLWPPKKVISAKIRDKKAETKSSLSVRVNFENMVGAWEVLSGSYS